MGSAEEQGKLWGASARDWAELFEPMSKPVWDAMLTSTRTGNGSRFVDLGCGGGGASVMADSLGAHVSGLDASEALISIARERIPGADFRVGDLEALPFQDDSFDITFASMSLMFARDMMAALAEMKRVTVEKGLVTIGVWGPPENCEYRHILAAIRPLMRNLPAGGGPFVLSEQEKLTNMLESAGFQVTASGTVDGPFIFANSDEMLKAVCSAGPPQAARQFVGADRVNEVILEAASPFRDETGRIVFKNDFNFVTAVA